MVGIAWLADALTVMMVCAITHARNDRVMLKNKKDIGKRASGSRVVGQGRQALLYRRRDAPPPILPVASLQRML